jgi:isopentenyl-diphosphate delta-isomerase
MSDPIAIRKAEHLELAQSISDGVGGSAGWEDIHLVHQALPTIDADMIDISTVLLGRRLSFPLVIAGMTGGHPGAVEINRLLARAAENAGVAIGVGSQRAALEHPELERSYTIVREEAPTAFVMGNIGISQLIEYLEAGLIDRHVGMLTEMVGADALAVHLNYLEEVVQPEGQTRARDSLAALAAFVKASTVPVIVKETGGGLSGQVARRLKDIGVSMLDVGGRGGTSFAAIEAERSRARGINQKNDLACSQVLPTIAVGGVRSGVDAAKSIALGAVAAGVGRPLLVCATEGEDSLGRWLDGFQLQLRSAMFLAGAHDINDLASSTKVVLGSTKEWFSQLGLS